MGTSWIWSSVIIRTSYSPVGDGHSGTPLSLTAVIDKNPPSNVYVHSTSGTLVSPSSSYDWRQVPSELICMNVASWLFERGCQFPISISALVIKTGGVGVGGISVEGTAVGVGGISVGGTGVGVGGISVGGTAVGVDGISVEGTGAAAGALHPARNKRTTNIFINRCE